MIIFILKLSLVFYAAQAVSTLNEDHLSSFSKLKKRMEAVSTLEKDYLSSFFLSSHQYPFTPSVLPILEYRKNTLIKAVDILFVGETHTASAYLGEKWGGVRSGNEIERQNSYDQENIYFNLIKEFSAIYPNHKKCLYLEYKDDSNKLNEWLKGLNENRSHYFLVDTARKNNWSIFAVDRSGSIDDITDRDEYMSEKISETIQNGECEKGIGVNGRLHLGCPDCLDTLVRELTQKKVKFIKIPFLSSS